MDGKRRRRRLRGWEEKENEDLSGWERRRRRR